MMFDRVSLARCAPQRGAILGVLACAILAGCNPATQQARRAGGFSNSVANHVVLSDSVHFPAAGQMGVSPDTPLRITFPSPPTLGTGKVQIFDAATNAPVESIDVAAATGTKTIGGVDGFYYRPIIMTGNVAAIYPATPLAYRKSYYVTVDATAFANAAVTIGNLNTPAAWRFTTKPAAPELHLRAHNEAKLTVAADGTGDFCTVQGAIDSVPAGNTHPITVFIKNGTYNEIIFFTEKNNLTLVGEDRKKTIIAYANSEGFNRISGNPFGADVAPNPVSYDPKKGEPMYHRSLLLAHRVKDLTIANLTLHNTTRKGGGQAEAIMLNGTPDAHAMIINVDLDSFQDTLQINGQAYLSNCFIQGDTDFMWGTGPCFFENCTCNSLNPAAFTQVRNPTTNHGFAYLHCTFEGPSTNTKALLSRIATAKYPTSEAVFLDCVMTGVVSPAAWSIGGDASQVHFWEYNSHHADGTPVDVKDRLKTSKQLKMPDDAKTIANYSNPTWFLGGAWTPKIPTDLIPH